MLPKWVPGRSGGPIFGGSCFGVPYLPFLAPFWVNFGLNFELILGMFLILFPIRFFNEFLYRSGPILGSILARFLNKIEVENLCKFVLIFLCVSEVDFGCPGRPPSSKSMVLLK